MPRTDDDFEDVAPRPSAGLGDLPPDLTGPAQSRFGSTDMGGDDLRPHPGDDFEEEVIDAEAPVKKRRSVNPRVFVAVMAVAVLAVGGIFGARALNALTGKPSEAAVAAPVEEVVEVEQEGAVSAAMAASAASGAEGLMGMGGERESAAPTESPQAAAAGAAGQAATQIGSQPMAQSSTGGAPASVATVANGGAALAGAVGAAASAKTDAAADRRLGEVEARVGRLEADVRETKEMVAKAMQQKAVHPKQATPGGAVQAKSDRPASKPRAVAKSESKKDATKEAAEPAAEASTGVAAMRLQAVYPSSGPDMQAWVRDGETVRVVAKGAKLGDATVLSVAADKVVTNKGIVR